MTFKCFAYGSNMFTSKMHEAAPSAKYYSIGKITGYKLRFNKQSQDGSGKGNIENTNVPTDEVWGVVFDIDETEREQLTTSEGGYVAQSMDIVSGGKVTTAIVYVARADRIDNSLQPYDWYMQYVLRGAVEHGLSATYIKQNIEPVLFIKDSDAVRQKKHAKILQKS